MQRRQGKRDLDLAAVLACQDGLDAVRLDGEDEVLALVAAERDRGGEVAQLGLSGDMNDDGCTSAHVGAKDEIRWHEDDHGALERCHARSVQRAR